MADPICTFLFSVFVLCTTFTIIRDILVVLMEGESPAPSPEPNDSVQCWCGLSLSLRISYPHLSFLIHPSGTPAGLKYGEVRDSLLAVNGVTAVHNLHIWALTMNQAVLTAHVAISEKKLQNTMNTHHIVLLSRLHLHLYTYLKPSFTELMNSLDVLRFSSYVI